MSLQDNPIVRRIDGFFKKIDLKYDLREDHDVFVFGHSVESKLSNVRFFVHARQSDFWARAVSPISGDTQDPQMMASLAELICRINYSLVEGRFIMDFNDGELGYQVTVDTSGVEEPTDEMIAVSIFLPIKMWEKYSSAFLAVIFGGKSAEEALELVNDD